MTKRLVLLAYDALCALALAALLAAGLARPAYAYVDPSVMTYAIQAIAGVAVALSTVLGVAMRRTRKKLARALGYDENARKAREPRAHRVDAQGNIITSKADVAFEAAEAKRAEALRAKKQAASKASWKRRLLLGAIVAVFAVFTVCFVAPLEIVAGSSGSLVLHLWQAWPVMLVLSLIVAAIVIAVLVALRGRAFDIALLIVASLGLCFYIQSLFLNTGLPQADGSTIDWGEYAGISALSIVVWIVIVVAPQVASFFKRNITQVAMGVICAALIIVQGAGVVSLFLGSNEDSSQQTLTKQGLLTVSSGTNVVEFVLDTYDTGFLERALAAEPDLLDEMTGFTWYTNSLGSMIPTRYGNVFLLTGQYPSTDEKWSTFLANRYARSTYLSDIDNAGYTIGVYSDTLGEEYVASTAEATEQIYSHFDNASAASEVKLDNVAIASSLMQCSLYRCMFWAAKPAFWFYTDEINRNIGQSAGDDSSSSPYLMDDAGFYSLLTSEKLSVSDDGGAGSYRYIHLVGPHSPYTMSADCEYVGQGGSSEEEQAIGSMRIVAEYIRQLKELGLYDSTTIVITADHGEWYLTQDKPYRATVPILLVKPAQSAEEDAEPYKTSDAPVTAANILPTVISALGLDSSSYGKTVFEMEGASSDDTRYFYATESDGAHDSTIKEYAVAGDANDIDNWTYTGNNWAAQE